MAYIRPKFTRKEAEAVYTMLSTTTKEGIHAEVVRACRKVNDALLVGPAKATGKPFQKKTTSDLSEANHG